MILSENRFPLLRIMLERDGSRMNWAGPGLAPSQNSGGSRAANAQDGAPRRHRHSLAGSRLIAKPQGNGRATGRYLVDNQLITSGSSRLLPALGRPGRWP